MPVKKVNSNGVSYDWNVVFIEAPSTTLEPDLAEDYQLVRRQLPLGERLPLPRRCVSCATHGARTPPNRRARADGQVKPCRDRGCRQHQHARRRGYWSPLRGLRHLVNYYKFSPSKASVWNAALPRAPPGLAETSRWSGRRRSFSTRWMSTVTGASTKSTNLDLEQAKKQQLLCRPIWQKTNRSMTSSTHSSTPSNRGGVPQPS